MICYGFINWTFNLIFTSYVILRISKPLFIRTKGNCEYFSVFVGLVCFYKLQQKISFLFFRLSWYIDVNKVKFPVIIYSCQIIQTLYKLFKTHHFSVVAMSHKEIFNFDFAHIPTIQNSTSCYFEIDSEFGKNSKGPMLHIRFQLVKCCDFRRFPLLSYKH